MDETRTPWDRETQLLNILVNAQKLFGNEITGELETYVSEQIAIKNLSYTSLTFDCTNDRVCVDFSDGWSWSAFLSEQSEWLFISYHSTEPNNLNGIILGDETVSATVSRGAEKLLCFFLPKRLRENIMGDLVQQYIEEKLPCLGSKLARWWFWKEAIFAIVALAFSGLIKIFERIRKSS